MALLGNGSEVPRIFHLIAGFFRKNNREHMRPLGIFRVTASKEDLQALETHMAEGNFAYLNNIDVSEPSHLVANFLKQILFEMREPLIPFDQYEQYGRLNRLQDDDRVREIQSLVAQMELQSRETLRYLV